MTSRPGTPWPNTATTSPAYSGVVHGVEGDRPDAGETPTKGSVATGSTRSAAHSAVATCPLRWPHAVDEVVSGDAADPGADFDGASDLFVTPAVEWVRVRGVTVGIGGGRPNVCACTGWCPWRNSSGARGFLVAITMRTLPGASGRSAQSTRATRPGASNLTTVPTAGSAPLGRGRLDDGQPGDGGDHRCSVLGGGGRSGAAGEHRLDHRLELGRHPRVERDPRPRDHAAR